MIGGDLRGKKGGSGVDAFVTLAAYVQPANQDSVSVAYTGHAVGVGTYLVVITSGGTYAGKYFVEADAAGVLTLTWIEFGEVSNGATVPAGARAYYAGLNGANGDEGEKGDQGEQGDQGPAGSPPGPNATGGFTLSGAAASDKGCYVALALGHSYIVRFEIVVREPGNIRYATLTTAAYRDGSGASVTRTDITRMGWTDEFTPGVDYNDAGAHTNDIWVTMSQTSGTKVVTIKAYIEFDDATF